MLSTKLISILIITVVVVGGLFYLGSKGAGSIPILGTLTNLFGGSAPGVSGEPETESAGGAEGVSEATGQDGNFVTNLLNKIFGRRPSYVKDSEGNKYSPEICVSISSENLQAALPTSVPSIPGFRVITKKRPNVGSNARVREIYYFIHTTQGDATESGLNFELLIADEFYNCQLSPTATTFKNNYGRTPEKIYSELGGPGEHIWDSWVEQATIANFPAVKIYQTDLSSEPILKTVIMLIGNRIMVTLSSASNDNEFSQKSIAEAIINKIDFGILATLTNQNLSDEANIIPTQSNPGDPSVPPADDDSFFDPGIIKQEPAGP